MELAGALLDLLDHGGTVVLERDLDPITHCNQVTCLGALLETAAQPGNHLTLRSIQSKEPGLRTDNDPAEVCFCHSALGE